MRLPLPTGLGFSLRSLSNEGRFDPGTFEDVLTGDLGFFSLSLHEGRFDPGTFEDVLTRGRSGTFCHGDVWGRFVTGTFGDVLSRGRSRTFCHGDVWGRFDGGLWFFLALSP